MIIKINLETWIFTHTLPAVTYIFNHITSLDPETVLDYDEIRIIYDNVNDYWYCLTYKEGEQVAQYDDDEITEELGLYITYKCDINNSIQNNLIKLLNANVIELDTEGLTSLIVYRQISENNVVSKELSYVDVIQGKFNSAIGLKDIELDVKGYSLGVVYNYAYVHTLKRYYYVDSVNLVSADLTRIYLKEDVLMSHDVIIRSQECLVTRSESNYNNKIADERYPLENVKTIEDLTLTDTGTGSLKNTVLNANFNYLKNHIIVTGIRTNNFISVTDRKGTTQPTGTDLPNISPTINNAESIYFLDYNDLQFLTVALIAQDDLLSYIPSVVWTPFSPTGGLDYTGPYDPYTYLVGGILQVKDDALCDDGRFHTVGSYPSGVSPVQVDSTYSATCPYFIIKDFTVSVPNGNYLDNEPYSNYEMYIPFVGWVTFNSIQILGKRLIVYYTLDYHSGMGTAYVYSVTDQKLLWSSNCQLGIKLDLVATNQAENNRQKQSNTLNMIMGMLASAVSIGVGVATENPVAIAHGVLSASKTIAGTVNSNMTMFERAQTSFGSGDASLHASLSVKIKRTYNARILDASQDAIFAKRQGYPANLYTSLSSLTGYTEVGDIQFKPNNAKIYQTEIAEIVALLKNGVIL